MEVKFALCLLIACCLTSAVGGASDTTRLHRTGDWVILGPFPNPERPATQEDRGAFDIDYLTPLGGEAKARIKPDEAIITAFGLKTSRVEAKAIRPDGPAIDFTAYYTDTDYKLAYAYCEIESPKDQEALFLLGSDDAVKVWINGKLVHENFIQRAAVARSDRFKAELQKGTNTVLCKVENGVGGWALIVEAYAGKDADNIIAEMEAAANARSFQRQELGLASAWPGYAFFPAWGGIPKIIWRDADEVRRLQGDLPLTVRWFDADLNEVKAPDEPGKYAAYIESKLKDGTPVRRAMTFFCVPPGLDIWHRWSFDVPYPGEPVDAKTWEERRQLVGERAADLYRDILFYTEDGAIELAGICEAKPLGRPATYAESAQVVNDDFHLALKLKLLGLTDKAKPLAPPKTLDKPTPVLHEGTPFEAGMKPDAKAKIDAVCKKWAEDSGEPFTILVARKGVIVTHEAFGPVDLDYRTDVMSITKAVSGMLFSRFLDQGYCRLDDPIGRVIPGFPTKGDKALTYRHLFTHTNGFEGHGEWGGIHNPWFDNVALNGLSALNPGRVHIYNGQGYDLAGKAMEYMTGKSIVRLFHEDLFRPLGINDVQLNDLAFGANLTAHELGILGQWLANRGSYGDKQFISEETFESLLPTDLSKHYPGVKVEWGIGLIWFREESAGSKDLIFGPRVIGHGSASSCILRVDLDHDLVIVQIRKTAGPKYAEYAQQFFQTIADGML